MGRLRTMRLGAIFTVVLVCVVVLSLGAYVLLASLQRDQQAEERLYAQADAFAEEMDAVWQFFDVNQDKINYNSDGVYDFKGLYCSIVGKGIGAIFTQNSDYTIRYTGTRVRNRFDRPDEFESGALAQITDSANPDVYYDLVEYKGAPSFRYVRAIYLKESCLGCHGEPAGELDVTGYPREGLKEGDFAGAISIIIPAEPYIEDEQQALLMSIVFFGAVLLLVAVTVFLAIDRFVTRPVSRLSAAAAEMDGGKLGLHLDGMQAYGEINGLVKNFSSMADRLDDAYGCLEEKVAMRTEEIRHANQVLEKQRQRLAQSNRLLKEANDRLCADNQHKDDFLAVMSHELRTPLTAIATFVEVLDREEDKTDREKKAIRELQSNTHALLNMVNDTLEMAAMQAGRQGLVIDDVDIVDIVNFVEASMGILAEKKNISLTSCVDRDVPIIEGDWDRIRHALENLVSNAIKFTDAGGKVDIAVHLCEGDQSIIIVVSDNGIGIAAAEVDHIFERFTQLEESRTRGYNGSGLGLSVVKDIVERHEGSVWVESEVGRGSSFFMELPIHATRAEG